MSVVATESPSETIETALKAAAGLTGMQVVFLSRMTPDSFTFTRVLGDGVPGLTEGYSMPRADSFCARMLTGAPAATSNAAEDPAYADSPFRTRLGIVSYVGVPVLNDAAEVIGTLCAMDTRPVPIGAGALTVLRALSDVIAGVSDRPGVRLRRAVNGWQIEPAAGAAEVVEDLTTGMCLADLLASDVTPPARPRRAADDIDEIDRLRTQVSQLEHALSARVLVEQAIGVLAERHRVPPREAFEQLRRAARSRGQKVHDLARAVVTSAPSATDALAAAPLPPELR